MERVRARTIFETAVLVVGSTTFGLVTGLYLGVPLEGGAVFAIVGIILSVLVAR